MRLSCPNCSTAIPSESINLDRLLATCPGCDNVFSFADQVPAAPARGSSSRSEIALPKGITLVPVPDGIEIQRRWFSPVVIFLTFFCVFWDGFLVVWYGKAMQPGASLMMKVFPLIHVAVGVGLTWFVIASYVNRTTIKATYERFTLRHGPVPWPGKRSLPAAEVGQLSVEERVSHGKNGSSVTYRLRLHTVDGKTLKLLTLQDAAQAQYIEQELERFLGIEDKPMAGEY